MSDFRTFEALLRALGKAAPIPEADLQTALSMVVKGAVGAAEAGFLLGALAARGRSEDGVAFVAACRALVPPVRLGSTDRLVDVVGTGGGRSTFNVSTAAAFVAAAAGVSIAKTGSRSYSGKSGFVETASSLGILPDLDWLELGQVLDEVGIVLVPPQRYAAPLASLARTISPASWKTLGVFVNAIGPALSPVSADVRVWGASTALFHAQLAMIARATGEGCTWIVRGVEGLDEASTIGATLLTIVDGGTERPPAELDTSSLGVGHADWNDLAGTTALQSGALLVRVLAGEGTRPQTEIVALNAAVTVLASGRANDLGSAYALTLDLVKGGAGARKLAQLQGVLSARVQV